MSAFIFIETYESEGEFCTDGPLLAPHSDIVYTHPVTYDTRALQSGNSGFKK